MKLPQNKIEIMDQVAAFASDEKLKAEEKGPLIRLALIHWNHVPDKSTPAISYEGFDTSTDSPVKELRLDDLIYGAGDYIDERCEQLNQELKEVSKKLLAIEKGGLRADGVESFAANMNELYKEKARIVEQLGTFNYQIIDREVEFNAYDGALNASVLQIKGVLQELINNDPDFEVGVDMSIAEHRDTVSFHFYLNNGLVDEIVSKVNNVFNDEEISAQPADISIRDHNPSLPNFKNTRDQMKIEREQSRLKEKMSNDNLTM